MTLNANEFLKASMAGEHSKEKIELRLSQEVWDFLEQISREREIPIGEAASWHIELGVYFAILRKEMLETVQP